MILLGLAACAPTKEETENLTLFQVKRKMILLGLAACAPTKEETENLI